MKSNPYLIILLSILTFHSFAQDSNAYIGDQQHPNVTVYSSSDFQPPGRKAIAAADNTINGSGLDGQKQASARFLSQAAFGGNEIEIQRVLDLGYEAWIEEQIATPPNYMLPQMNDIFDQAYQIHLNDGGDPDDFFGPYWIHFQYAYWQNNIMNMDLLRQKVAWALSQIFVISFNSDLQDRGVALADYYDIFLRHGLGNFEDLLNEVALHSSMGYYLSHYNNPKANPEENLHPDENFAREVMQLFTIGLYELNNDGSHKKDSQGRDIATYDMNTISEMARVFTGLGPGNIMENEWVDEPRFGLDIYLNDYTTPMKMYEEYHDTGEKQILGHTLSAGQDGMTDIRSALHILFMHDNVGPFIARRLIQTLVKSNPSPGYINRVASVFNNNGKGERGDLAAVIKSMLLDSEARECSSIQSLYQGKLRDPFSRYLHVVRTMDLNNINGIYWNTGYGFWESTGQIPLASPSVFNFYLPDYQPYSFEEKGDLFGPEFQIHHAKTSIEMMNQIYRWTMNWGLLNAWTEVEPTFIDYNSCEPLAKDPEVLLNKLDILYTHGQMSEFTRNNIKTAIEKLRASNTGSDYLEYRSAIALYLTLISPDFTILK
ncbi:DUF1800 domain-containing protein [Membranihabitans marinus]|uniref:DUF1800 domain-containing protein n=1 Tax=Membranihabitans marinus TaxID=1227546 RepID=UPI001F159D2F|nr:DUF1800 domain-containing protein [Membranihabitans marinus]